jgi:flagellin
MANDIVLSAGVRQNLLALQNTAQLTALTQNRLATGKKVNSALDNPSSFFTSQSLQSRAGDLNNLLDQIGQAQKTLEAANNGLTSLTNLVQSAKSTATQARQAAAATTTYGAVNTGGTVQAEVTGQVQGSNLSPVAINKTFTAQTESLGTATGTGTTAFSATVASAQAGNLVIAYSTDGGTTTAAATVAVAVGDTLSSIVDSINAVTDVGGTIGGVGGLVHASISAGKLKLDAVVGSSATFDVNTGSTNATSAALGLTETATATNTTLTAATTPAFTGPNAIGNGNGGNLVFNYSTDGGTTTNTVTVAAAAGDSLAAVVAKINTALDVGGAGVVHASASSGQIKLDALDADVDFSINTTASGTKALAASGLNSHSGTGQSTNLLDNVIAAGGASGSTFSLTVNGGTAATATFGYGGGQIHDLAGLSSFITTNEGASTSSLNATSGALAFTIGAGSTNSIGLGASDVGVTTALGLTGAVAANNAGGLGATGLSRTFVSNKTLATIDPTNLSAGGTLTVTINGTSQAIGLAATDTVDTVKTKLQANAAVNSNLDVAVLGGKLTLTAKNTGIDFVVSGSDASAALGLTSSAVTDSGTNGVSTSLLDNLVAAGGAAGNTLTIQVNGGANQTVTFGTGTGQVQTLSDLTTQLGNFNNLSVSLNGSSLNLQVASGSSQTSIKVSGSAAALTATGLSSGTTSGTATVGTASTVRATLQQNYNDLLAQIDTLAKDSSYNGINLLAGDKLKIVFNETGTSSSTVNGVTFDSNGLGLGQLAGSQFQDNTQIDTVISSLDTALTSLRTQASTFGSSLSTVQTRQDFTKNTITTLQTGADNLVLADTNQEGANMLALQTRQQLSTSALSLANQASQAVLRLFG